KSCTSRPIPPPVPRSNAAQASRQQVKELRPLMNTETDLLLLEVPILEDETVAVLHDVLFDLLTQFESHYGHQLRRHWQQTDARRRDPLEPWKTVTPDPAASELDQDFNDEIPF